jgi:hypothetical protein
MYQPEVATITCSLIAAGLSISLRNLLEDVANLIYIFSFAFDKYYVEHSVNFKYYIRVKLDQAIHDCGSVAVFYREIG